MSGAGAFCCALVLASHPTLNATTTTAVIITVRMDSIWSSSFWGAHPVADCRCRYETITGSASAIREELGLRDRAVRGEVIHGLWQHERELLCQIRDGETG